MFFGMDSIMHNILHIQVRIWGIFHIILSIPKNIVVDLNNAMNGLKIEKYLLYFKISGA